MPALRRLGVLVVAALALALAASCGSGETPEPQPTESSSRAERTQSVAQQEQQTVAAEQDAPAANDPRAGLMISRNVVGDPEAPVLIVEYSDFQ